MNKGNGVTHDRPVCSDSAVHADSKANNDSRVNSNSRLYIYPGLSSCNLSQDGVVHRNK